MGKRLASSKATRGVSKAKHHVDSSSSNPKTRKFRSQYNNLETIAKGGPSKKLGKGKAFKKVAKDALERKKMVDQMGQIDMIEKNLNVKRNDKHKMDEDGPGSMASQNSNQTTASFASVWSNCSNGSLSEFFRVWNPKIAVHKDALAVIAGLSQILTNKGSEQTDQEYVQLLFKILSSDQTGDDLIGGSLLALTFVIRKLTKKMVVMNFDSYYSVLKNLMEKYSSSKKKTIIKCLLRCFAVLSKAHPKGKSAIESKLRKQINISIRQCKLQSKINL